MFPKSSQFQVRVLISLPVAIYLLSGAVLVEAQVTGVEAQCRAAIATSMGKYVRSLQKAVMGCHKLRDSGSIPSSEDCNVPATAGAHAKGKPAKARNDAAAAIAAACAAVPSVLGQFARCPAPFQAADDGGTAGIDDLDELVGCLELHTDFLVQQLGTVVLGMPASGLTSDQKKCRSALGKAAAKIVDTAIKERANCQKSLDKDAGPMSFACAAADPNGKIGAATTKGAGKVGTACSESVLLEAVDSCDMTTAGLQACALQGEATKTAGGLAAMLWELPGACPARAVVRYEADLDATDYDFGWTGLSSDFDPVSGHDVARFDLACDADCANCVGTSVLPAEGTCRCSGDNSVHCSIDAECGASGPCVCFYTPPIHENAGGTPLCVTTRVDGPMTGSLTPSSGHISLRVPTRRRIHVGLGHVQPCPVCTAGLCDGGPRDGLTCSVDAADATFGDVSYDCPPNPLSNVSGSGLPVALDLATGAFSLGFDHPCDAPLGAYACACNTCSLDTAVACNGDPECAALGLGTCNGGFGAGVPRVPNDCVDLVCSPDPGGADDEGKCLAGPTNLYCDGFLRADGSAVISCGTDADCDANVGVCPGHPADGCGDCTISSKQDCFLDPIVAQGTPGQVLVGGGCVGPSSGAFLNGLLGLPGPFRIRQKVSVASAFCADGTTEFVPPGGSTCP